MLKWRYRATFASDLAPAFDIIAITPGMCDISPKCLFESSGLAMTRKSIRAALSTQERADILEEFNDPDSDIQVLIITPILGALGTDMQMCCNKGMLQLWCWNANMVDQVLGRLIRIGQKRFVEWHLYTVEGTIYEKYERIIWRKHSRQMAAERNIPPQIKGELGIVLMYEFIRVLYNQPFNRYLWEVIDPDIPSYDSQYLRRAADKISRIALWAYQNYTECELLAKKHPLDLYACAVRMMHHEDCNEGELDLTAEWLYLNADAFGWDVAKDQYIPRSERVKISRAIKSQVRRIKKIKKSSGSKTRARPASSPASRPAKGPRFVLKIKNSKK